MGIGKKKFLRPRPLARNNTAELDVSQRSSGETFAGDICPAYGGSAGGISDREVHSASMMQGRGRSAEKAGRSRLVLRGRPRSRLVEPDVPPRTARGRPSREFSAAGRDALSSGLGSRRGRSAENTFAGVLRGRPRSRLVEPDVPPRTARGRPSREFSAAGRDALSSGLGSRRGRSAEKTFAGLLRGRPRETLVVLEVKPRKVRRNDLRGTSRRTKTMHLRQSIPPLHIGRAHPTWASAKKNFCDRDHWQETTPPSWTSRSGVQGKPSLGTSVRRMEGPREAIATEKDTRPA